MLLGANYAWCPNLCCKNALCVKYKRNVSSSCLWEIILSCTRLTVYNSRHFDQGEPKCLQQTLLDFFFFSMYFIKLKRISKSALTWHEGSINKALGQTTKKLICSDNELISWVEFFCVFRYQRRPGCCPSTLIICCFSSCYFLANWTCFVHSSLSWQNYSPIFCQNINETRFWTFILTEDESIFKIKYFFVMQRLPNTIQK